MAWWVAAMAARAEIEGAQDGSSEDIDPGVEAQDDVLLLNDDG
jgi:hypothetical protein